MYFYFMTIGTNIKKLRISRGWTQVELAEKLKTTQQVITSYETSKKKPPVDKLPSIASIFGVSIEELLGKKQITINNVNEKHLHKNSRTAKVQELFEKLPPLEQRAIFKQIKALTDKE